MEIIRDISELTPRMQVKVTAFLAECHKQGVMCYPFETYRSQERQNELYAQGRNKPGKIVTWTKNSRHTKREAVDMAFGGPGKWTWDGDWDKMREIAARYGLESLYPRENAHFQDDGTEFNTDIMFDSTDYVKIMKSEVNNPVFNEHKGDDALTEANIKALIEIAIDRKFEELAKKINQ